MTVIGRPRSFHHKAKFVAEVDGLGSASFAKASELSMEIANVQHWEGGRRIAYKAPDLYDWAVEVVNVAAGIGFIDELYKRNIDLVQQDLDGRTLRRWSVFRAWPVKFVAGEWDNDSDEVVIESVTLTYDFFQLVQRSRR